MSPIQAIILAHRAGQSTGLYSVCCTNEYVLRAAMRVAREHGTPLLIEATSNQVDQFGGYTGMQPAAFRAYVERLADSQAFPRAQLLLGGDHLGPNAWQALPAADAMRHACDLIDAYVAAGFHKIHLDCSMACADDVAPLSDHTVATRSAVLAGVAEAAARRAGQRPPVYVVGTEVPVPGGEASLDAGLQVTTAQAAAHTLAVHRRAFDAAGLASCWERVIALVVQPGVDFDHSCVHHYDRQAATGLSAMVAAQPGLVYEAHSTDYQTEASLHRMVHDHFAILKVGPAATFALRQAWFALAAIENEIIPVERRSHLVAVLDRCMRAQPAHWQKHYAGSADQQRLLRQYSFSDRCRYYWGEPEVEAAVQRLLDNLGAADVPLPLLAQYLPEQYPLVVQGQLAARAADLAEHKVGLQLAQYARACAQNCHGVGAPA
ncbi:MAG: D-tagatose-bisphosphate aldolase, class II, non-catalytic subunit [Pseudomonadota bacterium]